MAGLGKRVSVVTVGEIFSMVGSNTGGRSIMEYLKENLASAGLILAGDPIEGARPNAPSEDVFAIARRIKEQCPDVVLSLGGGSTTDAVKAAIAVHGLGDIYPDIDGYFGTGQVTEMLASQDRKLLPHFAVMTAASSAAHLTKYSNITNTRTLQKMLIVDNAIVPAKALFDYSFTTTQPASLTADGALDGISHGLEVLMGVPEELLEKTAPVCLTAIEMIVGNIKKVIGDPDDAGAREAIGLGTDLGGYSIMLGGTNGAHLNSFSMTDILSHGRACALMNPYYVVFFSTGISDRLKDVGRIYKEAGYIDGEIEFLRGRDLGLAVAGGMINLSKAIGFPTTLKEVPGYTEQHRIRCLEAAKDPKLESKLKNMPVPMSGEHVDEYMGLILKAAENGDMSLIKNM